MNKYECAIDLSGPYASFGVSDNSEVLFSESFLLQNRKNALFFDKFFSYLTKYNITVNDISKWIVGTGPGSFTGLRIAASFVSGIVYNTNIETIGIPSAFPVASEIGLKEGKNIAVLFYAAKGALTIYSIVNKDGSLIEAEPQKEICSENLNILEKYEKVVFLKNKNIDNFISINNLNIDNLTVLDYFPVENMLTNDWKPKTTINDLLYVRPPSVTVPKE
ncbi:MAG TPA: tRNA (adenosine(37)-N6)-threonylcarbamoyltransferase complex dimerization subunit type 1 TsaB [Victivallales bacterium]|nr:tRNA (adenosine(37)-N6)-threonylcarbamoyltransferase complex dimerization subunit type 1 TsaB [Victivallales bacterium]